MSQTEKSAYYRALKHAGVKFDKHYRDYSTDELKVAYDALIAERPEFQIPEQAPQPAGDPEAAAAFSRMTQQPQAPRAAADPNEMPGVRLNASEELQPIRTDEHGRVWYQEEVLKPAYPKPRGRRVLKYMDTGTKVETVRAGEFVETFEVAGDRPATSSEVKITLPSYQVGIYKDRRFPFLIHTYNGREGFDLFEVQRYYGGSELVPSECKRIYVENVLCYDIRTVVRQIQAEYRQQQLIGKVK